MQNGTLIFGSAASAVLMLAASIGPASAVAPHGKWRHAPTHRKYASHRYVSPIEKSLLGIRVLDTYRAVLDRYGEPYRIYRAGEMPVLQYAYNNLGENTGAVTGVGNSAGQNSGTFGAPGKGGNYGRPGAPGMMGPGGPGMMGPGGPGMMGPGGPGMMGPGGPGGPPGMGNYGSSMPGMPGGPGMMGPGGPGMMGPGGMGGYGNRMSGMPGGPGMMGPGGPGMMGPGSKGARFPGMGGGLSANGANNQQPTFAESGGFQWVYYYPKQQRACTILFNKDKRVILIAESGRDNGIPTSRGVNLGSPVMQVYEKYGWPDSIEQQGDTIALRYNLTRHAQFNILSRTNRVVDITVFLTENQFITFEATSGAGMAGRSGMGPGMMGPGGPGMMGPGGPGMMGPGGRGMMGPNAGGGGD